MEIIDNKVLKEFDLTLLKVLWKKYQDTKNDLMKYHEIKKIIQYDKLTTFFQPIINIQTDEIIGYESLNRPPQSKWFSSTDQFYSFITETDYIFLYDLFCRNTSIKNFSKNLKHKPSEKDKLLFINIQPNVLMDPRYKPGETINLLQDYGLKPEQIVFELTEKKAVINFEMFEKVIDNYRSQGFRLAVDDAGSGFNSLNTLVKIQPEFIKLDRPLIDNITENEAQQKMVKLILEYAKQLNTYVIAEGIENTKDLQFIKELGVHFGQGYALGVPDPKIVHANDWKKISA